MTTEILRETERAWRSDPDKAKSRPTLMARSNGAAAVLEAGAFQWRADLPPSLGGTNQAPSPTAALLGALAGCAVVFIRDTLAPQFGVPVEGVEATAHCRSDARGLIGIDGVDPDLAEIEIEIAIRSSEPEARVRRLYDAWLERCPILSGARQAHAGQDRAHGASVMRPEVLREESVMTPSLYQRLGGATGIAAIVDDVVARHLANPVIKARFAKIDEARLVELKEQIRDFFGAGSGGPEVYRGRDMVAAHLGMNINEQEFISTLDDILAALKQHGVGQPEQHEVVAILYSLKDQVIRV